MLHISQFYPPPSPSPPINLSRKHKYVLWLPCVRPKGCYLGNFSVNYFLSLAKATFCMTEASSFITRVKQEKRLKLLAIVNVKLRPLR